jgi:hypothetical protein
MKTFLRRICPSPAMAVAFIALVVALGGTSYAAFKLPARSVGTKQLKLKAVTRTILANNAVTGPAVAADSLTGSDIVESSLGKVPSAASAGSADHAATADHAGSAGALDAISYKTTTGAVPPAPSDLQASTAVATAFCDAGTHAAGGGVRADDPSSTAIVDTFPDFNGTAWTVHIDNSDPNAAHGFTVYAVCVASAAAG